MKKGSSILLFVLVLFLFVRNYVPYVSSHIPISVTISFLFIAYAYFIIENYRAIKKYLLLFSIPLTNTLVSLVSPLGDGFDVQLYSLLQVFIWAYVCEYINRQEKNKSMRLLLAIMMIAIILTSITTYYGCLLMPGASRNMATGLADDRGLMEVYTNLNIGGFGFIYTLVLLLPGLFFTLRYRVSNFFIRLLLLSVIALFYLTIYTAEYTTAILFSVLAIAILFLPAQLSTRSSLYLVIISVSLILLITSFLPSLFMGISRTTESYAVSMRMEELAVIMEGGEGYGDAEGRMKLWGVSWNNFINHFITGTGTIGGGHSFILDTLSKYGLLGLFLVILQFTTLFKLFVKPYIKTDYFTLFLLVYLINFFLCLFNTLFFYQVFLIFFPLFVKEFGIVKKSQYN